MGNSVRDRREERKVAMPVAKREVSMPPTHSRIISAYAGVDVMSREHLATLGQGVFLRNRIAHSVQRILETGSITGFSAYALPAEVHLRSDGVRAFWCRICAMWQTKCERGSALSVGFTRSERE